MCVCVCPHVFVFLSFCHMLICVCPRDVTYACVLLRLRACFVCQLSRWKTLGCSNKLLIGLGGRHLLISYGSAEIGNKTHTHTHGHEAVRTKYFNNKVKTPTKKVTCKCFSCIKFSVLHSEISWEIKLFVVDASCIFC